MNALTHSADYRAKIIGASRGVLATARLSRFITFTGC